MTQTLLLQQMDLLREISYDYVSKKMNNQKLFCVTLPMS